MDSIQCNRAIYKCSPFWQIVVKDSSNQCYYFHRAFESILFVILSQFLMFLKIDRLGVLHVETEKRMGGLECLLMPITCSLLCKLVEKIINCQYSHIKKKFT